MMLVVTRRHDEQILIGDDIKVTVVRIDGQQVRLGIEAPAGVLILRAELRKLELGAINCDTDFPAMGCGSLSQLADPEALSKAALAVRETVRNLESD